MPDSWGCCAFAGDRGLLHPELTASATAAQAAEIGGRHFDAFASCNRTCELGMTRATGEQYQHVLEVVAWASTDQPSIAEPGAGQPMRISSPRSAGPDGLLTVSHRAGDGPATARRRALEARRFAALPQHPHVVPDPAVVLGPVVERGAAEPVAAQLEPSPRPRLLGEVDLHPHR